MSVALVCLVVAITDGDTIKARCEGQQVTIRLAEIDAPEKRQAFGEVARQELALLCYDKHALITTTARERYGRTVGRVSCDGTDASLHLVSKGLAWAYRKYLTDPAIAAAEASSRIARAGLWADPHAVAPWDWRRSRLKP